MSAAAREALIARAGLDDWTNAWVVREYFDETEAAGLLSVIGPRVSAHAAKLIVYGWIVDHKTGTMKAYPSEVTRADAE